MTDTPQTEEAGVTESHPSWYPGLIVKYTVVALYGLAVSTFGLVTLGATAGPQWELAWPVLLTVFALLALAGLLRSFFTRKFLLEIITTLMLNGLLFGYAVAIVARTLGDGDVSRLPAVALPLLVTVFPWLRLGHIVRRGEK